MLDVIHFILAGVVVGFCVGVTGVGGGSLMTPISHISPLVQIYCMPQFPNFVVL